MLFEPNYRYIAIAACNEHSPRLPLYEHIISPKFMENVLGHSFAELVKGETSDMREYFRQYCRFFKEMTYDTVSFEVCICEILPDGGAIMGGRLGPIQNRSDFESYPWDELPDRYWQLAEPQFDILSQSLPTGMRAIGGIGNGVFEISEDLVGFEYLSYMCVDDPQLFADIYRSIGNLMVTIWQRFLKKYGEHFCICRFGDDLGFKTGLLPTKKTVTEHIIPQYRRIISLITSTNKPFLWHSCGNIFDIMDDVIGIGINAKHSNEDAIAPFEEWINRYSKKIALFGGIDVDLLCQHKPDDVFATVLRKGELYYRLAQGYALGSGNSIPDYVPVENYIAMIEAAKKIRSDFHS